MPRHFDGDHDEVDVLVAGELLDRRVRGYAIRRSGRLGRGFGARRQRAKLDPVDGTQRGQVSPGRPASPGAQADDADADRLTEVRHRAAA
jgi:hypothetical protein